MMRLLRIPGGGEEFKMTRMSTRALSATTRLAVVLVGVWVAWSYAVAPPAVQAQGGTTAFTGARIFDGTGRPAIEQGTLVISNGRVQQVGPQASVKVPDGATRVDASGKTIVPGLINSHGHVAAVKDSPLPLREQLLAHKIRICPHRQRLAPIRGIVGAGHDHYADVRPVRDRLHPLQNLSPIPLR